jgi:hypothetical protein
MTDIGLVGVEELEVARARAREVERARGRAEQIEIIATHGPWLVGSEDRLFRQTGALDPRLLCPRRRRRRRVAGEAARSAPPHPLRPQGPGAQASRAGAAERRAPALRAESQASAPGAASRRARRGKPDRSRGGENDHREPRRRAQRARRTPGSWSARGRCPPSASTPVPPSGRRWSCCSLPSARVLDCLRRKRELPDRQVGPTGLLV